MLIPCPSVLGWGRTDRLRLPQAHQRTILKMDRRRRLLLAFLAFLLVCVFGGVSGALFALAGAAAGVAVGVVLVLALGYLRRRQCG